MPRDRMTLKEFARRTGWPYDELMDTGILDFSSILNDMGLCLALSFPKKKRGNSDGKQVSKSKAYVYPKRRTQSRNMTDAEAKWIAEELSEWLISPETWNLLKKEAKVACGKK